MSTRTVGCAPVGDDQRGVNVKVIVRCRPTSELEKKDPTNFQVVSARVESKELFVSQTIPGRKVESYSKTFTFDGVCNQYTSQQDLFNIYVVPIVEEVLQGFNCTIFAYGQTGTGKTYTMEGDFYSKMAAGAPMSSPNPSSTLYARPSGFAPQTPATQEVLTSRAAATTTSSAIPRQSIQGAPPPRTQGGAVLTEHAGIIPRAVHYIFEKLEGQDAEYSVRVSYLEIYNEELNDLLNDGEKQNLRIYEDPGVKRGLAVDRLEEVPVNNPQDILNILSIAVKKRRTAETLLNRQSSRSHCIFSVTIHMKETNIEGEDVIKIGKLNLVDLAGSENIQRSGANTMKDRAKEAGMINQSLLTLGRVINALVEHASYVPYRDSKLTRLLQDSLGGRTKTCIVATVSPSSLCLEETLSTLDYAYRAKNIRNRPEINQRMTKRVMIRELNQEIERLKIELQANREKNGVYLPLERYAEMEAQMSIQGSELTDAATEIKRLKAEASKAAADLAEVQDQLAKECRAKAYVERLLQQERAITESLQSRIQEIETQLHAERAANDALRRLETALRNQCHSLLDYLKTATGEIEVLRSRLADARHHGQNVVASTMTFVSETLQDSLRALRADAVAAAAAWDTHMSQLRTEVLATTTRYHETLKTDTRATLERVAQAHDQAVKQLEAMREASVASFDKALSEATTQVHNCLEALRTNVEAGTGSVSLGLDKANAEVHKMLKTIRDTDVSVARLRQEQKQALQSQLQTASDEAVAVTSSVREAAAAWDTGVERWTEQLDVFQSKQAALEQGMSAMLESVMSQTRRLLQSQKVEIQQAIQDLRRDCQQLKEQQQEHTDSTVSKIEVGVLDPLRSVSTDVATTLDRMSQAVHATSETVEGHHRATTRLVASLRSQLQENLTSQAALLENGIATTQELQSRASTITRAGFKQLADAEVESRTQVTRELDRLSDVTQGSLGALEQASQALQSQLWDMDSSARQKSRAAIGTLDQIAVRTEALETELGTTHLFAPTGTSPERRPVPDSLLTLPESSEQQLPSTICSPMPPSSVPMGNTTTTCVPSDAGSADDGDETSTSRPKAPLPDSETDAAAAEEAPEAAPVPSQGRMLIRSVSRSSTGVGRASPFTRAIPSASRRRDRRVAPVPSSFAFMPSCDKSMGFDLPTGRSQVEDGTGVPSDAEVPMLDSSEPGGEPALPSLLFDSSVAATGDDGGGGVSGFQRPTRIHQLQMRKKHPATTGPDGTQQFPIDNQKRRRAVSRDSRISS